MLPTPKAIKLTARNNLKNNWVAAIAAIFILFTFAVLTIVFWEWCSIILNISGAYTLVKAVIMVAPIMLIFVLNLPLLQGVIRWFWFLQKGIRLPHSALFYSYTSKILLFKSIFLHLNLFIKTIVPAIAFVIPAFAVFSLGKIEILSSLKTLLGIPSLFINLFGYLLLIAAAVLTLNHALNYVLAPVIFISEEGGDIDFALNLSKNILKVQKLKFFKTLFSFLGLIILSFLGIPAVFTLPFMFMSYVVFARFSIVNSGIKIN